MRFCVLPAAALLLSGCGYVGEPLPPALRRPVPVTDLAAVERGSRLLITFTVPGTTTEGLPITATPEIELRIGSFGQEFRFADWYAASERVSPVDTQNGHGRAEVPVAAWAGKMAVVGVNVHGPSGRSAGWSNFAVVPVIQPLGKPGGLELSDGPDSVKLAWKGDAPEYRVFRRAADATDWVRLDTTNQPAYTDSAIQYGSAYDYYVQAQSKTGSVWAESEDSEIRSIKPSDRFPPAPPTGLSASAASRTIELLWDRNAEKDFASYRVYRDGKIFIQNLSSPAFSDDRVASGERHEYRVTAVDSSGNESAPSHTVTAAIP